MRPRAELQVALLHVEGEPANVDVAGALQDAGGDVLTVTRRIHQHVGVESRIETLVRTGGRKKEGTVVSKWVKPTGSSTGNVDHVNWPKEARKIKDKKIISFIFSF